MSDFKYRAFISYSHTDEKWAKWLHRRLESYRPPKSLNISKTLTPIFRDRDELAASRDLSASILEALGSSENLVVICSPAAARSHWVNEEVEEFTRLGRGNQIFSLFVDGKPNDSENECLPESLRATDGHEPLGADVRPVADGRTGALLKIAAALLDVRFSELTQRENQARVRRLVYFLGASAAGMLLMVFLTVFALVSREEAVTAQLEADRQKVVAVRESEIANQVTEFLVDLFRISDPSESKGNDVTAREVLDRGAAKIDDAFRDQPDIRARLLSTIGTVYESLGLYEPAEKSLVAALELQRESDDPRLIADALDDLGWLHREIGDYESAESTFRESLSIRRRHGQDLDSAVAWTVNHIGVVLYDQGKYEEADEMYRSALAILTDLPDEDEDSRIAIMTNIANILADEGRSVEALPLYREVLKSERAKYGEVHLITGFAHDNLALVLQDLGQLDEAEEHFREALRVLEVVYGPEHPEVAQTLGNVSGFLFDRGELDEAESMARRAIDIHRNMVGGGYYMVADSLSGLAEILLARDQVAEAARAGEEAMSIYENALPEDHDKIVFSRVVLGAVRTAQGRYQDAEDLLLPANEIYRKRGGRPLELKKSREYLVMLYEVWDKSF